MAQGTVKFFNAQKGFAIVQDNGGPDVRSHLGSRARGMSNSTKARSFRSTLKPTVAAESRQRPICRPSNRRL
jgi:hypothetical protein